MRADKNDAQTAGRLETWLVVSLPLLLAAAFLTGLARHDLDARITDLFFDAAHATWPWKHAFWAQDVVHTGGRDLVALGAILVLGVAVAAGRIPGLDHRWRWPAAYFVVAFVLATGLVAILKSNSGVPCPWDAVRYGGDVVHDASLRFTTRAIRHSRCSPGGHASGGFAWMASYWALRPWNRGAAWIGLGTGLGLGGAFSLGQVARGAHFPSHNAWTLALTWIVCVAAYFACPAGRLWRQAPAWALSEPRLHGLAERR